MDKIEIDHKNNFRDSTFKMCEEIRPRIELIKRAKGNDINRSGIHNAGITLNNKMSEILHYYYEKNVPFFTDSLISNAIYDYLYNNLVKAVSELNQYMMENVIAVDCVSMLRSDNHSGLIYYKEYTDKIYEFDLKKDIPMAIESFLSFNMETSELFNYAYLKSVKEIIDEVKEGLEELDLMELYDECESILEHKAGECVVNVYDNQKKKKRTYKK